MNSIFSVDDLSDLCQSPAMYRSASEWEMQRLLEELTGLASSAASSDNNAAASQSSRPENGDGEVVEIRKFQIHLPPPPLTHPQPSDCAPPPAAVIDSEDYRAILKSKLDLACRAVAMSRESGAKAGDFSSIAQDQNLLANNFLMGSIASAGTRSGIPTMQSEANGGTPNTPAAPALQTKEEVQARQTTSGSSKDDSDDDDLEGDTGTNEHTDPADVKRARRMQSNRESARRSRRRKQAQLNDLETQVGQLRDERNSLLSRHTDINKKCDESVVNNRILRANIETLRAKVKMAEEQVKRVTGWNPMLLGRSNTSMGGQIGGQVDATGIVAGPMQPNSNQFFQQPQPVSSISPASHCQGLNNVFSTSPMIPLATNVQSGNGASNIGGMPSPLLTSSGKSMANMPSMQHVQKEIDIGSGEALPTREPRLPHVVTNEQDGK